MADPFLGEIRMFASTFAPRGWALCDGQLLLIVQNDALYSLFGTTYGGDGGTTFGLPDLRGRVPIHQGAGIGLSPRVWGSKAGAERVTLSATNLPAHRHIWQGSGSPATETRPPNNLLASGVAVDPYEDAAPTSSMGTAAVGSAGSGQSHANLQPFLCLNFIVALVGVYPSRN